jgi:excisionase family DNA binding protein
MDPLDRLLTVKDLAAYLGVPVAAVYGWRYRRQGGPLGFRVGRHLRFRYSDVEQWVAAQQQNSGSPVRPDGRDERVDRSPLVR